MGNPNYNQNYTREQIEDVLSDIKQCINSNRYIISMNENRQENTDFINEYNIYPKKRKEILLNISVEDFCHTLKNTNKGYEYEVLYVFAPEVELYNAIGEVERVFIYIKFNLIDRVNGNMAIVISFHKLNRSIDYLFK